MRNFSIKKKYEIGYDERGFYLGKKNFASLDKTHIYRKIDSFLDNLERKNFKVYYSDNDTVAFLDGPSISIRFNFPFLEDLAERCESGEKLNNTEEKAAELSEKLLNIMQKKDLINIDEVKSIDEAKIVRRVKRSNQYTGGKVVKVAAGVILVATLFSTLANANSIKESSNNDYESSPSYESVVEEPQVTLDEYSQTEPTTEHINESSDSHETELIVQEKQKCFACNVENIFYTNAVQEKYNEYYEKFCEIAPLYGLPPELVFAMAIQESSCDHYNNLDPKKSAVGIMQIERGVYPKEYVLYAKKYNINTGNFENVSFSNIEKNCEDEDYNINFACALFQWNMTHFCGHNLAYGIVCYNMGCGTFCDILEEAYGKNYDVSNLDPFDYSWLPFRYGKPGTPDHLERVVKNIEPGKILEFTDPNTLETYTWQFECASVRNDTNNYSR